MREIPQGAPGFAPGRTAERSGFVADIGIMMHEFARQPATVGAIAPSSHRLAQAIAAPIPCSGSPVVVELGPGTGAFTELIQSQLDGRGHHIAVEVNPRLAALTARRHPRVEVVEGSAEQLAAILSDRDLTAVDVVISGLPWAALPGDTCRTSLDAICAALNPGGVFTTFGYTWVRRTPRASRFRKDLLTRFEEVVTSQTITRNLPPAFVYYARRPRPTPVT
jgi:phospholipid N-methyltransferase